ncbi:hypothetical protein [Dyadobacter sp. CY323]|nr:hypothetical protein [Dyadobacter sp. CY323]MCE6992348.1 hypothetical protein [Dyadobacter sp. CY323]
MKDTTKRPTPRKLTGDQVVQKKLDEANAMLRKIDPSFFESMRQKKTNE